MTFTPLDSIGSFALETDEGNIEAIRWTHRDPSFGWDVRDDRGAGRNAGVRTKREAQSLVRAWASLAPAKTFEWTPLRRSV